jgi:meso-butanediol dehydrogenase/(S,S)-butanediol dehydrogenase/diacetyl reductase
VGGGPGPLWGAAPARYAPSMRRFEGYAALLTAAGQGIGEAIAGRLAGEGARVLVTDLDGGRAEEAASRIRTAGGEAEAMACDVGDTEAVRRAVARAAARFGRLDTVVSNAYSCHPDAELFEDEPEEHWHRDLDATLTGAFRLSRAAMPHLAAAGGRGSIVNIGSVNGLQDFGNHAYSAAKAGLASLTRTLAGDGGPRGVRVNLIAPGTVRTAAWAGRDSALERAARVYPLGRVGLPEDIASAAAFLASPEAAWITGVTLPVDGGITAVSAGFQQAIRE